MNMTADPVNYLMFVGKYIALQGREIKRNEGNTLNLGCCLWPQERYDGKTARFIEMDPVIAGHTILNMYEYCNNNPLNLTDRYGELCGTPWIDWLEEQVQKVADFIIYQESIFQEAKEITKDYIEDKDKTESDNNEFRDKLIDLSVKATLQSGVNNASKLIEGKKLSGARASMKMLAIANWGISGWSSQAAIDKMDISESDKAYLKGRAKVETDGAFAGAVIGSVIGSRAGYPGAFVGGVLGSMIFSTVSSTIYDATFQIEGAFK